MHDPFPLDGRIIHPWALPAQCARTRARPALVGELGWEATEPPGDKVALQYIKACLLRLVPDLCVFLRRDVHERWTSGC